jgi:hypothetical protein
MGLNLDWGAVCPSGHQAVLKLRLLAQFPHQDHSKDREHEDDHKADEGPSPPIRRGVIVTVRPFAHRPRYPRTTGSLSLIRPPHQGGNHRFSACRRMPSISKTLLM